MLTVNKQIMMQGLEEMIKNELNQMIAMVKDPEASSYTFERSFANYQVLKKYAEANGLSLDKYQKENKIVERAKSRVLSDRTRFNQYCEEQSRKHPAEMGVGD